ncbi:MAG: hypothetical protein RR177_05355 [Oscillospiraceae bacterium]
MRRYIMNAIKGIAFFTGLIIMFGLVSFAFIPKDNRGEFGMHDVALHGILAEKKDSIDVLIVGDSETYCAFSPMQLWRDYGYTSYVCGTPGQPLYDSYNYINMALENQSLKMVILETNTVFGTTGVQKDLIGIINKSAKVLMPIFEYHNRWKNLSIDDFTKSPKYTWSNDLKGFEYRPKVDPWTGSGFMKRNDEVLEIPLIPKLYIEQINDLCNEKGIKFLMVGVPAPFNWNYQKHNGVQMFADEHEIPYLDMNLRARELKMDWMVDSLDKGDHLNFSGAQKVTAYLGKHLSEKYNLPDHRGDEYFSSWNDSLKKYQQIVQ